MTIKQLENKLSKVEGKIISLKNLHNLLVEEEFILEEQQTDLRIENKSSTKLDNKIYKNLDKQYDTSEKIEICQKELKSIKAKIKRAEKSANLKPKTTK